MYNNKNSKKFFLFDFCKYAYVREFDGEDELIDFIGKSVNYDFWRDKLSSIYFDSINMNGRDIFSEYDFVDGIRKTSLRQYMFIDEENRIIDIRNYKKEIISRVTSGKYGNVYKEKRIENAIYGEACECRGYSFRYRIDPIPICGAHHRSHYLRSVKTFNEIRQNKNPEMKDYVRPKRKHLPTLYDDIPKVSEKSWKSQSKKRKQWM